MRLKKLFLAMAMSSMMATLAAGVSGCTSTDAGSTANTATGVFAPAQVKADFVKGADISTLREMEAVGYKYYGFDGQEGDALTLLQQQGFNYVRLRLWNDPYDANGNAYGGGTNDLETDLALAKRAKDLGMGFLLDFHYSDFWTDPGKQFKPKAWANLSFDELKQAVYQYTYDTIVAFKEAGVMPDMVQVGNEITSGMLWPDGKSWGQGGGEFDRLSELLKSGIAGVKDAAGDADVKIMLHLDKGTKQEQYKWWFDEITARNVPFDVIGMSMYTWWDGPISDLSNNIKFVNDTYHKDVYVVEAAYAYGLDNPDGIDNTFTQKEADTSGYPATVEGQAQYLKDLMEAISSNENGKGLFYWEPAWKAHENITWATKAGMDYTNDQWKEGNSRENQALFDDQGKILESVKVFNDAQ